MPCATQFVFDNQLQHLSAQQVTDLNPFEQRSVPYLKVKKIIKPVKPHTPQLVGVAGNSGFA